MNSVLFTDIEHRILLAALGREKEVCKQVNEEMGEVDSDGIDLVKVVESIEQKVYGIQHEDTNMKKHFLTATEPEWDSKNRFWRCPSCKRRIHEYHGFCKHCGKKVDWMPLMKKRKKEAEIRDRKDRKKARSCKE